VIVVTWKAPSDKVLVSVEPTQKTTNTGIVLPDKVKRKLEQGLVLAAGPDAKNVQPGDTVSFLVEGAVLIQESATGQKVYSMNVDFIMAGERDE
jgi:co-chaperonin GroES (HSP10)